MEAAATRIEPLEKGGKGRLLCPFKMVELIQQNFVGSLMA